MNIAVPTDYIKPTVRFDLNAEERDLLIQAQGVLRVAASDDIADVLDALETIGNESEPADENMLAAQASMMLIARIMVGALTAGNSVESAHLAAVAMLSQGPQYTESIALDWARPDLSDLTGEPISDPAPDLPDSIHRMNRRIVRTFTNTAMKMPMSAGWAKLGVSMGLDADKVAEAAGSLLDFPYIFGDVTCNCSFCEEN